MFVFKSFVCFFCIRNALSTVDCEVQTLTLSSCNIQVDVEETPALAARTGVQISNFGAYVDYCVVCHVHLEWHDITQ